MNKPSPRTKMKPVRVWALFNKKGKIKDWGNNKTDLLWLLNHVVEYAGGKVVPVLIFEAPKSRKR